MVEEDGVASASHTALTGGECYIPHAVIDAAASCSEH